MPAPIKLSDLSSKGPSAKACFSAGRCTCDGHNHCASAPVHEPQSARPRIKTVGAGTLKGSAVKPDNPQGFASASPRLSRNPYAAALLLLGTLPVASYAQQPAAPASPSSAPQDTRLSTINVHAQSDTDNDDYNPGVSTVGGKTPTAVHDLAQTATVIDRAVMQAQGAASLVDVLRNVPGIVLGSGEGGQIGNNIYLRGFSARTDIFLDGFRDRGQYQRDTFSLDSIEVLEGPASLLFGRGSTGGVINQVSKRPSMAAEGEAELTLGTNNYYRTTLDVDHSLSKDSAFRVALMAQDVDATRSSQIDNKDYGIAPSVRFGIGTATEVTLSLLSQHNRDVPDYGFPMVTYTGQTVAQPLKTPFSNYYGFSNNSYAQDVNVFSADFTHKFDQGLTIRSNTQYSQYRTQPAPSPTVAFYQESAGIWSKVTTEPQGTPLDQLDVAAQLLVRSIRDSSLYNQTDFLYKVQTGPLLHHLAAGTELGRDQYANTQYGSYNFNYNDGTGVGANLVGILNLGQSNDSTIPAGANVYRVPSAVTNIGADTLAGYFNDTMDIGKKFKLIGGLRWDDFKADQNYTSYCYAYKTADITDPTNNTGACNTSGGSVGVANSGLVLSNKDSSQTAAVQAHNKGALQHPIVLPYSDSHADYHWSTRAGAIWQPTPAQSYYFAYGTSFDPLVLEGSGSTGALPTSAHSQALYDAGGGEAPQTTRSYEVGGKWDLMNGNLSLSTALFDETMDNVRGTDPVSGETTLDGNQRVLGTELKAVGRILPNWQVIGGYTYLDGKTVASQTAANVGKTPADMAKNGATLWTTYDFLQYWEAGGGAVFASNVYANANDLSQVPGYTRLDATLAYRTKPWSLRLNLQNLADRKYFYAVSGGRVTPADGRRALLTFSYHFL